MSAKEDAEEQLKGLLERRKNYFLLQGFQRKIYQRQFEKIQSQIIALKLQLEIYHDELDLFSVKFSYIAPEAKRAMGIMQKAHDDREIRWLRKIYNPQDGLAEYIGRVSSAGIISDPWLQEKYLYHVLKREGYIDCPWPTVLSEEE